MSAVDNGMMSAEVLPVSATVPQGTADALRILAQAKDPAAWAWIVEREGPAMFRFASRILGNAAAADDVCQEAFLHVRAGAHLFHAPVSGDADAAAHAWLLRVTASAAAMWSRGERRRRVRERIAAAEQPPETAPEPGLSTVAARDVELLKQALQALPETQRLPVVLHHLGGQDYESIGHALGISAGTARVRVHRARDRLRDHLARLGAVMAIAAICSRLNAAEVAVPAASASRWQGLLHSPLTPVASKAAIFGGLSLMTKIAVLCSVLAVAGLITFATRSVAAVDDTTTRTTITGTARSLGNPGGGFDPHTVYATVTSANGTVYDVTGGAGMIISMRGDGKQVSVTGVVSDAGGHESIQGRSTDVAIAGVPLDSNQAPPAANPPDTTANPPRTTANPGADTAANPPHAAANPANIDPDFAGNLPNPAGNQPHTTQNSMPGSTSSTTASRRVTLTGIAHAMINVPAGAVRNPSLANGTLTVTTPNTNPPVTTVYDVYGYAGVVIANRADGKQVEVTGSLGTRNGKPFIYGRSIDVTVDGIPVDGGQ